MKKATKKPDFENFLKVLRCDPTAKPALFEMFMGERIYEELSGKSLQVQTPLERLKIVVEAFANAGYDYATTHACNFGFPTAVKHQAQSVSLNEGSVIQDRESFEAYPWPDPDACEYSHLADIAPFLPDNMKLMVMGPGGVLENVTALVGYDKMCYMLYDDPELMEDIFAAVGSRMVRYYENAAKFDSVGVLMSNDDWGFKTQTFFSIPDMRKYVFPWHKKIAAAGHSAGKPVLLHSCGYMGDVMDDIIEDMQYDGKHSYEDCIIPVEESYRRWGGRIAILGGIDLDYLMRTPPEEIRARCKAMLELAGEKGGYALGSGNSIPDSVPLEQYFAMLGSLVEYEEV